MKIQFASELQSEIDVVGLGLTFKQGEIKDVSDEDGELLLRSSAFARVDDEPKKVAAVTSAAASSAIADTKLAETPAAEPKS